jgi:hypothetical protein
VHREPTDHLRMVLESPAFRPWEDVNLGQPPSLGE